jgi:hypothetical protein
MSKLIIEGECTQLPEVKRFYMEGIILKSTCPVCGRLAVRDLGWDYLSYGSMVADFICEPDEDEHPESFKTHDGGYHEWSFPMSGKITLTADG